ncbi:MAG: class I SAM-dependent methyltransferase [Eubacterium sp.]|jgi:23S rRNA (cytosine1962-C5)-methyltransferase|nr:class I SAM-dependent methyltransferase [Eubacterium sp.]
MRIAANWSDYTLIDAGRGERLERWGNITLIRPDPQIIWENSNPSPLWKTACAIYHRSPKGGGEWEYKKNIPESWRISYKDLNFMVKPTGFKHTGLFPEQAVNWDYCREFIINSRRRIKLLNLFAYTGGATLSCLAAGAEVCHLDAVKGMVEWAKLNVSLSGFAGNSKYTTRWIVDDAMKFLKREIKRGNKYDAIILDPPSYGRGTNGEMWKLTDCINELMLLCTEVLSDNPLFLMLNSYTSGLSPSVMAYLLKMTVGNKFDIFVNAEEIGLMVEHTGMAIPCGNTAVAVFG